MCAGHNFLSTNKKQNDKGSVLLILRIVRSPGARLYRLLSNITLIIRMCRGIEQGFNILITCKHIFFSGSVPFLFIFLFLFHHKMLCWPICLTQQNGVKLSSSTSFGKQMWEGPSVLYSSCIVKRYFVL